MSLCPQLVTPSELNLMSNEELSARMDEVLATADEPGAADRSPAAPFVTNALALRVSNCVQKRINVGVYAEPLQIGLALVVLHLTGVEPPDDRGDVEKLGQRWYNQLTIGHHDRHSKITKRGNKQETKDRQRREEDESLLMWPFGEWPPAGTVARVPRTKQLVARAPRRGS